MNFEIIRANIADIEADAIVLPANEKLKEGAGASRAIFEAAGRKQLKKACEEIGHCNTGSAVPTPAFDLNAKYIIHAAVPRWNDGEHDEYGLLSSVYLTALKLADIMHCESIAFPLLASGNNGFNRELAFKIAAESIALFDGDNLKKVVLVVYGENTECFVRSQGYDVIEISETKKSKKPLISDETKNAALKGIKCAFDWLKNKENQKRILELGVSIAFVVANKGKKGVDSTKVIQAIKKFIK